MNDPKDLLEVWTNTAAGMRWCQVTDNFGRQKGQVVKGGGAFTITPFDRQMNQASAASPEQDMFRNGTFVLVKPAQDTIKEEIMSPESLTDTEITTLIYEIMAKNVSVDQALEDIKSPIALTRIYEAAVIDDLPKSAVEEIRRRLRHAEGTEDVVERDYVAPAPPKEKPVKTPRGGIPEADTEKVVMTKPEVASG